MDRPWRSLERSQRGFVLIALIALLAMGGLYFFIRNLSPEFMQARSQQKTDEALTQAREALIGYAVQYRERQIATGTNSAMYGFLPMPDVGTSRLHPTQQNPSCTAEGCAMDFINGAFPATTDTVIGRLPWRTLGIEPIRDGHGECLWYAVSANFKSLGIDAGLQMNWDTLSQMDVVVANGTAAMISAVASAHDRPIAVIFAPGPPLAGQDRSNSAVDSVTECGGNYLVSNYLDPVVITDLGGVTNYLAGATNSASGDTSGANKSLSPGGAVNRRGAGTLWAGNCPANDATACTIVANDTGATITSELLFRTLRGSSYFRTDINAMLDRMTTCLRDQVAAGPGFTPDALAGFTAPTDKNVGRIPTSTCYDDTQNPLGYFSHYRDQVFVASKVASDFTVTDTKNTTATPDDTTTTTCAGALLFANQRGSGQSRSTTAERNAPANYLEGTNLGSFTTAGSLSFSGPIQLLQVFTSATGGQTVDQDIVRCIPAGASLTVAAPVVAASAGDIQLAAYAPATRALTLGSGAGTSNYGAAADNLFACAWTPETQTAGTGFRSYFRFRIRRVGEGFTFAVIDGDRNINDTVGNGVDDDGNGIIDDGDVCGAARQHLGYSGNNGGTRYIQAPKLAIEFDTSRQCNSPTFDGSGRPACVFTESGSTLSNGRNDPCYTTSCWEDSPLYPGTKQSLDNSSHVAIVYWGYGSSLTYPLQDDNVHDQPGLPMVTDPSSRPGPRNPAPVIPYVANPVTIPGIAPLDRMGVTDASQREFHARIEVTRSFTEPADAQNGVTGVQVKFWIEAQSAASISAMTYNAGSPPTLTIKAASHGLNTGNIVVIKDAVPGGYNGEYPITRIDANSFTATLPDGTANPGPYISAIGWVNVVGTADQATVTSANHGLLTGDSVTIAGAIPPEYNGVHAITRIDNNSYQFDLELGYEPGDMEPAVATAKALTPRAIALADTTRPMSVLDAAFKPLVADTATIYDEQKSACAGSAPLCPNGQTCGADNMCYRPSFRNLRLGFTVSERPTTTLTTARGQLIEIRDRATTWLP